MSSRSFNARTSHSEHNPQICGLNNVTACSSTVGEKEVPGGIVRGQCCFYLTCRGDTAQPSAQIQRSNKKDDYETGYRVVPSGRTRTVGREPYTREMPIFKWQEWKCPKGCSMTPVDCGKAGNAHGGGWHDVAVWEKMSHVQCAADAGYQTPWGSTTAHRGDRTKGHAHRISPVKESPLVDLGRAMLEDDEAA